MPLLAVDNGGSRTLAFVTRSFHMTGQAVHGRSTSMNEMTLLDLTRHALLLSLELALPVLTVSLVVGVLVSLFQAVTQIQEMTLTFVPKVLAITAALVVLGPWMLSLMVNFTTGLFNGAPSMLH
jgi:flagellar biosynthesis protein FliQ